MLNALYDWFVSAVPAYRALEDAGIWMLRSERDVLMAYLESYLVTKED